EPQMPRLVATIKEAQKLNGGSDLKNQFYVFKRPPTEFEKDVSYLTGVLFKKSGFDELDIQMLKTISSLLNLEPIYDPISNQEGIFKDIVQSNNINEIAGKYPDKKLTPATDDIPYFEHNTDFGKINFSTINETFSQGDRAMLSMVQKPVAETTLVILL